MLVLNFGTIGTSSITFFSMVHINTNFENQRESNFKRIWNLFAVDFLEMHFRLPLHHHPGVFSGTPVLVCVCTSA